MKKKNYFIFVVLPEIVKNSSSVFEAIEMGINVDSQNKDRVQVGRIFEFVDLILFLKTYLGGGQAPSSQTVGPSLIPLGQ
jgi:hypothetical protein